MCHVKVVLLCKGRGGDAASFRPNRDESQWWNRRDALVRCVASYLHGPWSSECSSRELVLLHDEDLTRIHMSLPESTAILPTERNIVSAWKQATTIPEVRRDSNLPWKCRVVRHHQYDASEDTALVVQKMDNKRQVLEHLQAHCSIEFLRENGFNSKADVVLRKTNKKALVEAWYKWTKANKSATKPDFSTNPLESIFKELLTPENSSAKVIAGVLHESCDSELPCFNPPELPPADPSLHVILFLGAVRDMHPSENKILRQVCAAKSIPLTGVRLGQVAEFTSKILSIVAFHQASGVLGPALLHQTSKTSSIASLEDSTPLPSRTMHLFCSVPISISELSIDLDHRSNMQWHLVRVTVATLWRSHIMRSSSNLVSLLTFLFDGGTALTLDHETLVSVMAEQHQAAPSEFQILQALIQRRDANIGVKNWLTGLDLIVEELGEGVIVLDITKDSSIQGLTKDMYAMATEPTDDSLPHSVAILMSINNMPLSPHKSLRKALEVKKIPITETKQIVSCQDEEAASITILQHFLYQRRLMGYLESHSSRKKRRGKSHSERKLKKRKQD